MITDEEQAAEQFTVTHTVAESHIAQLEGVVSKLRMQLLESERQNKALSAQLEATNFSRLIQGLVKAEIDEQAENYFESEEFRDQVAKHVDSNVEDYLEHSDLDVDEAVSSAIEDALQNVRIEFRR
jgi:hypothetical protein